MRRSLALGLAAAAVLASASPAAAEPTSPEERAAAIARPAVVLVEVNWHGWIRDPRTGEVFGGPAGYKATTSCSGAVVHEDGYVVTAGACLDPAPIVALAVAELTKLGRVEDPATAATQLADNAVLEGATEGSSPVRDVRVERVVGGSATPERDIAPATVVDVRGPGDVGVLKVPRGRMSAVALADVGDLPAGTPVLAIGYPEAEDATEPVNESGQITTRRAIADKPYYEVSAPARTSMTGGPVVDMDGRVIGLTTSADEDGNTLVTASTSVADLLRREGVEATPSANDRNYTAGLEHYFDGEYAKAVEFFDAVLAATPDHQQAGEYRRLAAGREDTGRPLLVWLIAACGAVAVLAAAAGAILLVMRRRHAGADLPTPPFGFPMPTAGPASGPIPVAGPVSAPIPVAEPPADGQVTTPSVASDVTMPAVGPGKDGTAT
ncbi:MAG: hypothetical protein GEV28_11225 [Actinophytocola sp.]|uniref:S1 family peptidase n=1 Tax=Actinophytocola sp. TaxID=1872138 RepID=UPI0013266C94|nr:serine protease [Actinophytocola sp.]MPZ80928.1 hypothetical protein [Actinophytocola sp.]